MEGIMNMGFSFKLKEVFHTQFFFVVFCFIRRDVYFLGFMNVKKEIWYTRKIAGCWFGRPDSSVG